MTPDNARALYRRQIGASGEVVTLARGSGPAVPALARFTNPAANELIDTLDQTQQVAIVLAEDLVAGGFPVPPGKNDVLATADGQELVVQFVDATTRRVAGETIAYGLTVVG